MAKKSKRNAKKKTVEIKARRSSRKATPVKSGRGAVKRSSRAMKPVKTKTPPGAAKGAVHLTCSDCNTSFALDVGRAKNQETITCPVCEHRAQSPSNDILHQIALYKGIEHKNQLLSVAAAVVGALAMLAWCVLTADQARAEDPAVFYGPIALGVVSALFALVFGAKYERSRWVTFF